MKAMVAALLVLGLFGSLHARSQRVAVIHDSYLIADSVDLLATEQIVESGWPLFWLRATNRPLVPITIDGTYLILDIIFLVIVWGATVYSWRMAK